MAAMLVYSEQKNFNDFFCLGHQHGRYAYCLLCLLGLCDNLYWPMPLGKTTTINELLKNIILTIIYNI